jgi:molybdopterin-guanine dinucleotide biosynthesis protein MobB
MVGAIKHIHLEGFTFDREGSNTWRFTKAGSKVTVAVSPEEIAIIKKTDASLYSLDQIIDLLKDEQLDVIFIEGFHSSVANTGLSSEHGCFLAVVAGYVLKFE